MKKALAGLLIFGMVFSAMVVPAAAAGRHGGGCHRTWAATGTEVCPWTGESCPWDGQCGGWCASGLDCPDPDSCPWDGQCSGWCVNGGLCDGTGWARHHS